jgi:hypothetical protein
MESYWILVYPSDPLGREDRTVPMIQRARTYLDSTDTAVWNLCFGVAQLSPEMSERFRGRPVLVSDPIFERAGHRVEVLLRAPRKEGSFRSWMNRVPREEFIERFWPTMQLQLQALSTQ